MLSNSLTHIWHKQRKLKASCESALLFARYFALHATFAPFTPCVPINQSFSSWSLTGRLPGVTCSRWQTCIARENPLFLTTKCCGWVPLAKRLTSRMCYTNSFPPMLPLDVLSLDSSWLRSESLAYRFRYLAANSPIKNPYALIYTFLWRKAFLFLSRNATYDWVQGKIAEVTKYFYPERPSIWYASSWWRTG